MKRMALEDLERLELGHLERIAYYFVENLETILEGLRSRLKIKDDWYQAFITTKGFKASDLEMGAERILHAVYSSQFKHPNSSPIGADMMYEASDAFIHIDVKTISTSNLGDYRGKIVVEKNQTSYPLRAIKGLSPNLPTYYSIEFRHPSSGEFFNKPALTYFLYILHAHASEEILSVLLINMPNGELYQIYGDRILSAGKSKHNVRYAFKAEPRYLLLSRGRPVYRVHFLYKAKRYTQRQLTGIPEQEHRLPIWYESEE